MVLSPAAVVEAVAVAVAGRYVFPEAGTALAAELRARAAAGAYDQLAGPTLGEQVTADMFAGCADHHLRLRWRERPVADPVVAAAESERRYREKLRRGAGGVRRVQTLGAGVALVELTQVGPPQWVGADLAAAFQLVAGASALLLDLRTNPGGTPEGAALVCSYLLPAPSTHVNTVHSGDGVSRQFWTTPWLPAPPFLDRPVWVLTGPETFSGAEEVAYNLQAMGRATVVGERTRGGAHPTDRVWLDPQHELMLPVGRSVNPVTGANWEGVGVRPDVEVPAAEAETTAVQLAHAAR
ncbi:S41 family peptidase [Pilimelia columellifera]|uniref:S41 family peptidase n=1 Tax=Pilimelia columellifera subsp. columellifera TaxID=706583 RepID=A0ABN3NQJ9_9ACTN